MTKHDFQPGSEIDHYLINRKLGEGATAVVYCAHDTRHRLNVAIKFLKSEHIVECQTQKVQRSFKRRFMREAKMAAPIMHPNIAKLYRARFDDNYWYISMEFVDGPSLRQLIDKGKQFQAREIIKYLGQVIEGLGHVWEEHRVIHRDITPNNLMIGYGGDIKIIDLGLAKPVLDDVQVETGVITVEGTPVGTPHYAAPEQFIGAPDIDHRTDIFAIGATFYEICTGKLAFDNASPYNIYRAQLDKNYKSILHFRNDLPSKLVKLIDGMLEPDRENRIGGYFEVRQALKAISGRYR